MVRGTFGVFLVALLVLSGVAFAFPGMAGRPMGYEGNYGLDRSTVAVQSHFREHFMIRVHGIDVNVLVPGAVVSSVGPDGNIELNTPSKRVVLVSPVRVRYEMQRVFRERVLRAVLGSDVNRMSSGELNAIEQNVLNHVVLKPCTVYDQNTMQVYQRYCYEAQFRVRAKLLGIIPVTVPESVQCDAETGSTCQVVRPWWSFLVFGKVSFLGQ